ncbi:hypothetical protein EDD15DRAFT_2203145 [Pisolithus albus]|nr:hypothetical protein EDD15DRAFT_2203145 [Pisolithus albus]
MQYLNNQCTLHQQNCLFGTATTGIYSMTFEEPLQTTWVVKGHMCRTSTPLADSDAHLPFNDLQIWYKVDLLHKWPASGLTGHDVVDVRLIMCPVSPKGLQLAWDDHPLVYIQRFDLVPQHFHFMESFWLNSYFDEEFYYTLSLQGAT